MSSLGKTVIKKVGDKEVICRELTVACAREILASDSAEDLISDALFVDVRLRDLEVLTSLTKAEIEAMFPSDIGVVVAGCKEANPDFFGLLARLSKVQVQA